MCVDIKKGMGLVRRTISSIKFLTGEIPTYNNEQMERRVDIYSKLYSRQNTVSQNAINSFKWLQTMDELETRTQDCH